MPSCSGFSLARERFATRPASLTDLLSSRQPVRRQHDAHGVVTAMVCWESVAVRQFRMRALPTIRDCVKPGLTIG